ncbi:MAG: hypothetical protein IH975_12040 [Nitrospinae bacterium]|nr:hypothetical protein [Nitrospinota bacterium]
MRTVFLASVGTLLDIDLTNGQGLAGQMDTLRCHMGEPSRRLRTAQPPMRTTVAATGRCSRWAAGNASLKKLLSREGKGEGKRFAS